MKHAKQMQLSIACTEFQVIWRKPPIQATNPVKSSTYIKLIISNEWNNFCFCVRKTDGLFGLNKVFYAHKKRTRTPEVTVIEVN